MEKLTVHQKVAKRDAEENHQPKKHGFKAKQHYYVLGEEATKEAWMNHLSEFGTPNYHGIVIDENGKSIQK